MELTKVGVRFVGNKKKEEAKQGKKEYMQAEAETQPANKDKRTKTDKARQATETIGAVESMATTAKTVIANEETRDVDRATTSEPSSSSSSKRPRLASQPA